MAKFFRNAKKMCVIVIFMAPVMEAGSTLSSSKMFTIISFNQTYGNFLTCAVDQTDDMLHSFPLFYEKPIYDDSAEEFFSPLNFTLQIQYG